MLPRVARQKAQLLELAPQFRVELHQSPGNSQTAGACLTGDATAAGKDQEVEFVRGFGGRKCLPDRRTRALGREIALEGTIVDLDFSLTGTQNHASHRRLAAACT